MGREVRLVPPGWEHPRDERGEYIPQFDENYRGEDARFQVYENISEGTPVTPAFTTEEELEEYLVEAGDDWDRKRGTSPPSRGAVREFIKHRYAPTGALWNGRVIGPYEA